MSGRYSDHASSMYMYVLIIISFISGFFLELMVQPGIWLWLQPQWIVLLMVYWLVYQPRYFGLFFCFVLGLISDIVHGTLLGKHALVYTAMALLVLDLHRRMRFALGKMALIVFALTLMFLLFNFLSTHSFWLLFRLESLIFLTRAATTSLLWVLIAQCTQTRRLIVLHD